MDWSTFFFFVEWTKLSCPNSRYLFIFCYFLLFKRWCCLLCAILSVLSSCINSLACFSSEEYSRTPLFRTRFIRSPRYFEGRPNSLGFTLMFSVIYYQLFRTRLFRIPRYFELIVLSLHRKSTPLFRTCQKQSTYIRAQLETYCILFELEQNIQRFFNATASADLSDI